MWSDAPEDDDNTYLRENPGFEQSLWRDWVGTLCRQRKVDAPTSDEWLVLEKNWYHGKAPLNSFSELKEMRRKSEEQQTGVC